MVRGFVKLKQIKKSGSGWVGQAPTRILILFWNLCVFLCFLWYFHVTNFSKKNKKLDSGVGGWCLTNPNFFLIFGFNLT